MKDNRYKFKINNNAFTLAEVLITLVIVGVVAALTISPLVNTYVESSTVSKVKKGISILGQAKKLAETQNGPIDSWNYSEGTSEEASAQFWNFLKPHISVARECASTQNCYETGNVNYLNGNEYNYNYSTSNIYYKFVLADGSVMMIAKHGTGKCNSQSHPVPNVCAVIVYDVNGSKGPNTMGIDIFHYLMNIDGVYPHTGNDCRKSSSGFGCANYILKHSNMKYLH